VSAPAEPAPLPAPTAVRPPTAELAAAFAAIYIVWGSTFLAIRYAVETIPPFAMVAARCLLGGAVLVGIALVRGRSGLSWPTWREWGGSIVLGAFLFVGCHGVIAYAEERVPSGTAALCLATIPLFVPLLSWRLLGSGRPSLRTGLALLAAFAGVALLVARQGTGGGLTASEAGLLLFAAFSWAAGTIATRRLPVPRAPLAAAAAPLLAGGVMLVVISLLSGEAGDLHPSQISGRSIGGLLYLVVLGTIVTFAAYIWLLGHVAPTRVATYAFVNPAVAVLIGWAIANEHVTAGTLVATAVIIVAVAVAVTDRSPPASASRA
jgi:drug/metabolite transporter (DMT)-like permease